MAGILVLTTGSLGALSFFSLAGCCLALGSSLAGSSGHAPTIWSSLLSKSTYSTSRPRDSTNFSKSAGEMAVVASLVRGWRSTLGNFLNFSSRRSATPPEVALFTTAKGVTEPAGMPSAACMMSAAAWMARGGSMACKMQPGGRWRGAAGRSGQCSRRALMRGGISSRPLPSGGGLRGMELVCTMRMGPPLMPRRVVNDFMSTLVSCMHAIRKSLPDLALSTRFLTWPQPLN
mmetsp:Transcript_71863/g.226995  ORF Transcript_71863/g.226995 Transcript_71863/m.226995 type:complete len:232 (+) Transcript_71863:154-849(+)